MAYLEVSSNDTLSHKALPGSPETLCGKAITDQKQPRDTSVDQQAKPNTNWVVQPLECDICLALAGGLLKETVSSIVEAGRDCPFCEAGKASDGYDCTHCLGTGWLDEGDSYDDSLLTDLNLDIDNVLHGTKVAEVDDSRERAEWYTANEHYSAELQRRVKDEFGNTSRPGVWTEPGIDNPIDNDRTQYDNPVGQASLNKPPKPVKPLALNADSNPATPPSAGGHFGSNRFENFTAAEGLEYNLHPEETCENCGKPTEGVSTTVGNEQWCTNCASHEKVAKTATNWTRDGQPIEEGSTVIISTDEAARTPFLDLSKVTVSEKKLCSDCHTDNWLQYIASCDSCGEVKCQSCMEVIGLDSFFGMCKKCASTNSDLAYEVDYMDSLPEQDRFLSYLMREDDDNGYDSLFLPNGEFE